MTKGSRSIEDRLRAIEDRQALCQAISGYGYLRHTGR